jgi:ribonuclease Z
LVSAFKVDHGGEDLPAFGYRIDCRGRAAVLSGDTTFNENLIEHARGADLLVHEVTAVAGSAAENAEQLNRISSNHTTPQQAGEIFARVEPKLAVYNDLLFVRQCHRQGLDRGDAAEICGSTGRRRRSSRDRDCRWSTREGIRN